MARPTDVHFFEVPLPEKLPPNLEWMRSYHEHSAQLCQYLTEHGAKSTAYHAAIRCVTELRQHLVESKNMYSPEAAIEWFDKSGFHDKGTKVTLFRLSDLYQYGSVQPSNAFPVALPYQNKLHEIWNTIPIETISVILGHADAKTTRKSYATPSVEMLRNNMKPGTDVEPEYSDAEKEKPLWKDDQELARLCGVR